MILTGKCLEAFNKELGLYKENFNDLPIACRNALIIEFFDSDDSINFQDIYLTVFKDYFLMKPISFIQTEAIKKANEIFNNR